MFCDRAIASFGAVVVFIVTAASSYGAAAAFSDDSNHVYLIGSKLPKGTALDIDLTTFTAKKLSLGVPAEVRAIVNAPSALLFVTEKSLYRLPLAAGKPGKICEAPAGCLCDDVACNRAQRGILLLCRTKDGRDWPAYYLREQESKPTSLVLRRVNALVGAVFDRDGHLFFASGGDLWEGDITTPSEPGEELPAVEAFRFAPVALRETANTTPNSTGARELAVAGRTVYAQMTRMGGSGWGEMISVSWPPEPKEEGKAPRRDSPVKANVEAFKSALAAFRAYGSNQGVSYLCGSPDGRKVFFATRYENDDPSAKALRFYLGDDTGEVHPLDELKIDDPD
jgi:hypothetical protein